jgi:hypothetical protein
VCKIDVWMYVLANWLGFGTPTARARVAKRQKGPRVVKTRRGHGTGEERTNTNRIDRRGKQDRTRTVTEQGTAIRATNDIT